MSIIKYNYDIDKNKYVGEHFQVKEFASFGNGTLYTNDVLIDTNLVDYLERIFSKVHASKAIISSGYRNSACDKAVGGSGVGQHVNGRAADICYYDENGYIIPSKIIVCIAFDIGMPGTATIDTNYSHLDTRTTGVYRGNESIGYSNYWTDPYSYFGVSKEEVRQYTKEEEPSSNKVNAFYRVKTQKHGWLSEVKNLEDYAGYEGSPIIGLAMRVDVGSIKYRVTTVSGKTLGWITGCDIDDYISGWAGNGEPIALVEAYYFTPDNIRPYQYAYYKVNDYPYQKDLIKGNGFDGFAGVSGVTATKFQMYIGD